MNVVKTALLLALLLAVGRTAAGQAPACRTALNVPCYTIRGTHTQWQLFTNGPTDLTHWTSTSVRALRGDGSSVNSEEASVSAMFRSDREYKWSRLYLAPENAIITINHGERTIARREPLIWHDLPYRRSKDNDANCESGIRHFGTDFKSNGTGRIAGIAVVKWYRPLGNGSEEQYLAPSLDCIALKFYRIQRNALWLPTFIDRWEATSVQVGQPAGDLFTLPSGYRQVEDPGRAWTLRFGEPNRGAGGEKARP